MSIPIPTSPAQRIRGGGRSRSNEPEPELLPQQQPKMLFRKPTTSTTTTLFGASRSLGADVCVAPWLTTSHSIVPRLQSKERFCHILVKTGKFTRFFFLSRAFLHDCVINVEKIPFSSRRLRISSERCVSVSIRDCGSVTIRNWRPMAPVVHTFCATRTQRTLPSSNRATRNLGLFFRVCCFCSCSCYLISFCLIITELQIIHVVSIHHHLHRRFW